MVSEKLGLPFYRGGGGGGRRRRRTVHNTNFLEKWLFSIIYCGKNIQSIFIKISVFVYRVKNSAQFQKHVSHIFSKLRFLYPVNRDIILYHN